ncbi:MAG: endonuclease [Crocinitomicaceae bacterium]|nr:endonuclease [Crocinitomicaceae bacterium]
MKKIIYSALLIVAFQLSGIAQAVLPTTYDFATTTLPANWTSNTGLDSYAGGNPGPSLKLAQTGKFLLIHFASNPGTVTYDIAGNSFAPGIFDVLESVDGITFTTVFSHGADIASSGGGTYVAKVQTLNAASRYVKFIYTLKTAGNVGLDNVTITPAPAGPEQEINIKDGASTIISGSDLIFSSNVGVANPKTMSIENLGTVNLLNITSSAITGANASDFVLGTVPTSVTAASSQNFTITFTAAAAGTRNAVLTIGNNDADENPYIINLIGYGNGLASAPTVQATNLTFTDVKTYRFKGAFTPAANVAGYIVLRKNGAPITGAPTNGMTYQRGDIVGDAQVVYSGTQTSFYPSNITAGSNFHFAVFTYNGTGSGIAYNTTAPLTAVATTPATMMPAGYYSTIDPLSNTFVADLHDKTYPHTQRYYSDYISKFINLFIARDTVNNQRVLTCVYSGQNVVYTEPFAYTANNFSREHTYCHSWMPTSPNNTDSKEYSDYHHLFPANQNDANAIRSNYPLGEVVTVTSTFMNAKFGKDINGRFVYEPKDDHKGDAARALFYEAITYNSVDGKNWAFPNPISSTINYGQDQTILKQWNIMDPPSNWEIARNDFIDSLQSNRNPFVDHPEFACYINFSSMNYFAEGCEGLGVEEKLANAFIVYPNPAKNELFLNVDGTSIDAFEIIDMQGRKVMHETTNLSVVKVNTSLLKSGSYIVRVSTPYGDVQRSLIIE